MINQVVIVGRLTSDVELLKSENGTSYANMTVAVPRSFKNSEGIYETDFIPCSLLGSVAENTAEYCKKGDMIGIKGRLKLNQFTDKETDKQISKMEVAAERITFLTSKAKEEPDLERY